MRTTKKPLTHFLYEMGMMKKIEHCGTKFAGVKNPDSLAEHSLRAAQIGYIIAIAEGANPDKVVSLCVMHDIGEIRIGDTHRIADRYMDTNSAEQKAVFEQTQYLPPPMRDKIRALCTEFNERKTREAIVAKDADLLETLMQAKEYMDTGYKAAKRWLENGSKYLRTKTAKRICAEVKKTEFSDWWNKLNVA